jgi:hypothetical protein
MSRYNENERERGMSTFAHVTLGILTAVLIITTAGGLLIYLNGKAEERQLLILTHELTRPAREAAMQRERERVASKIARENAIRAAEAATREREAFRIWYKKPARCEVMSDHETRVFCANDFMRARTKWQEYSAKSQQIAAE